MLFRSEGQGKRCTECSHVDEEHKKALSVEARVDVMKRKTQHMSEVLADRSVHVTANKIALQDAKTLSGSGHDRLLKILIDGVDQAKFRCPHNLVGSADLEPLWRPALHVTGCIVVGHLEAYFILQPDQCKDGNMNCTLVSRAFDLVRGTSLVDAAMPRHLCVALDNTCREGKNLIFVSHLGTLVGTAKF